MSVTLSSYSSVRDHLVDGCVQQRNRKTAVCCRVRRRSVAPEIGARERMLLVSFRTLRLNLVSVGGFPAKSLFLSPILLPSPLPLTAFRTTKSHSLSLTAVQLFSRRFAKSEMCEKQFRRFYWRLPLFFLSLRAGETNAPNEPGNTSTFRVSHNFVCKHN